MVNSFNYARLKKTADRLISRFGPVADATFNEPGAASSGFNPGETSAPTQHPVRVVVLGYNRNEIDGLRILATDKKIFVAIGDNDALEPTSEWTLTTKGVTYQIVPPVRPLQPGDVKLLWEVQCRRA